MKDDVKMTIRVSKHASVSCQLYPTCLEILAKAEFEIAGLRRPDSSVAQHGNEMIATDGQAFELSR